MLIFFVKKQNKENVCDSGRKVCEIISVTSVSPQPAVITQHHCWRW